MRRARSGRKNAVFSQLVMGEADVRRFAPFVKSECGIPRLRSEWQRFGGLLRLGEAGPSTSAPPSVGMTVLGRVVDCVGWLCGLDADGEVDVAGVTGVAVEVVGGAAVELVADTEFAADDEAEAESSCTCGDPAEGLQEGGLAVGKRFGEAVRDVFEAGAEDTQIEDGLHSGMIAQVGLWLASVG